MKGVFAHIDHGRNKTLGENGLTAISRRLALACFVVDTLTVFKPEVGGRYTGITADICV